MQSFICICLPHSHLFPGGDASRSHGSRVEETKGRQRQHRDWMELTRHEALMLATDKTWQKDRERRKRYSRTERRVRFVWARGQLIMQQCHNVWSDVNCIVILHVHWLHVTAGLTCWFTLNCSSTGILKSCLVCGSTMCYVSTQQFTWPQQYMHVTQTICTWRDALVPRIIPNDSLWRFFTCMCFANFMM